MGQVDKRSPVQKVWEDDPIEKSEPLCQGFRWMVSAVGDGYAWSSLKSDGTMWDHGLANSRRNARRQAVDSTKLDPMTGKRTPKGKVE